MLAVIIDPTVKYPNARLPVFLRRYGQIHRCTPSDEERIQLEINLLCAEIVVDVVQTINIASTYDYYAATS